MALSGESRHLGLVFFQTARVQAPFRLRRLVVSFFILLLGWKCYKVLQNADSMGFESNLGFLWWKQVISKSRLWICWKVPPLQNMSQDSWVPNPEISHSRDQRVSRESPRFTNLILSTFDLVRNQFWSNFYNSPWNHSFVVYNGLYRSLAVEFKLIACSSSTLNWYLHTRGDMGAE